MEGWEIRDRLVTREGSDDAPGPDLLETEVMDDGAVVVIVKPLKELRCLWMALGACRRWQM